MTKRLIGRVFRRAGAKLVALGIKLTLIGRAWAPRQVPQLDILIDLEDEPWMQASEEPQYTAPGPEGLQ